MSDPARDGEFPTGGPPGASSSGVALGEMRLHNRARARERVALAQGVLWERYRLASAEEAFELLRTASQARNVKLNLLAEAVIATPGPATGAARWFPGRASLPAPALSGLGLPPGDADAPLRTVLGSVLARVTDIADTAMGNVQLVQGPWLRLEAHTGLDEEFTEYFAFVAQGTTACAEAATSRAPVTIHDVVTAGVFSDQARRVILDAGSRACHSIPVLSPTGHLLAVMSTHHRTALGEFTEGQAGGLGATAEAAGAWLSWYRRTHVLNALEHLHRQARPRVVAPRRSPEDRPGHE
ncbi:ANTAR domain-containing protein [Streptomyces sp. NPDC001941]|uniref:ANTAR domain-containing protein n=1 Tax=Streptomyces sp. NPDC001941 TaxID=3154659 RepID=UPI00332A0EEA